MEIVPLVLRKCQNTVAPSKHSFSNQMKRTLPFEPLTNEVTSLFL